MEEPINTGPRKKQTLWYKPSILEEVRGWPKSVAEGVGRQLNKLEYGGLPSDFKPLPTVGSGVYEIRYTENHNQYRLIYVTKFEEAIYVLHVISKKKTQKTSQHDIELAQERYRELMVKRKQLKYE